MSYNSFIDPVAGFFGQDADSQRNNLSTDASGNYKPTFMDQFWGRADEGQGVLDDKKNKEIKDRWGGQLEGRGLKFTDGMTAGDAQREILEHDKKVRKQEDLEARTAAYNDPTRRDERDQRDKDRKTESDRYYDLQKQRAEDKLTLQKNRLEDKADNRRERADNRQMQLEMYERKDARDEKNRRRESIQALVAGLSSLGAAFAV